MLSLPTVRRVLDTCKRVGGIESVYVVGSFAKGTQRAESDLDVVAVTRFPTCNPRYDSFAHFHRENVDVDLLSLNLISRVKKGESTSIAPSLGAWIESGILVYGESTFPQAVPPMDTHCESLAVCRRAAWFLWHLKADKDGVYFHQPIYSQRWLIKEAGFDLRESAPGLPSGWKEFGAKLKESVSAGMDSKAICEVYADWMEPSLEDLRFSYLDEVRYVWIKLRTRGWLMRRTLLNRVPIQVRTNEAMYLLLRSQGVDLEKISASARLIEDYASFPQDKEPSELWERVQFSILRNYETMMGLGDVQYA